MNRPVFVFLALAFLVQACIEPEGSSSSVPDWAQVYAPVYVTTEEAHAIVKGPAKPVARAGKIVIYQNFLLINAPGEGFHVIDNTNPAIPRPLFFVHVPGSNDVALKEGILFVDNYSDIVALRITENEELEQVERLGNVMNNQEYPPFSNVYFECIDKSKGIVASWVLSSDRDVKCYRP